MLHYSNGRDGSHRRIVLAWQSGHWCVGILWLEKDLRDSWRTWFVRANPDLDRYSFWKSRVARRIRIRGFISFVLGLSRELVGYGDTENEHQLLIHRIMALPLVVRVMWFGRGEAFWNW